MAFSFGNTGQSAFGSTPAKPIFGSPSFGATTATTTTPTNTGFGFGSTFGQPISQPTAFGQPTQQQQAAFGSTFGQSVTSTPPNFGATPQQTTPAFGSTFGTPTSSGAQTFGTGNKFGTTGLFSSTTATTKPTSGLFGTPSTSVPSLFSTSTTATGLFGSSGGAGTTTTTTPSLFGGGISSTPSLFGTSTTTTTTITTPNLFGSSFGTTSTSNTGGGLFGTTAATTTTGFNLFGANTTTTTTPSLFGSSFGSTVTGGTTNTGFSFGNLGGSTAPSFGGFGSTTTTTPSLFGATSNTGFGIGNVQKPSLAGSQLTTPQQQQNQLVFASIYSINIFNDERDDILKKWNMLQACWGTGKGYYNPNQPPIEYNQYNPFYRFKAVAFNVIPEYDNSEGLVKLTFNKKYSELNQQKQILINGISGILGNKSNLKITIDSMKAISDIETEVRIFVIEKCVTGNNRNIPATDLANYLNQQTQKQQLINVGVNKITALITPTKTMLEEYLKTIPQGFDAQMWQAAITDNPNPNKFMPVPIYGFADLKARKLIQDHETGLHKAFQQQINKELDELKKKHAASVARINEFKLRFLQLQHRTLKILVKQESIRKAGLALQPEEEFLKGKLETMYAHLNVPTQFKGKLNELISMVKFMDHTTQVSEPHYKLLPEAQNELKEFLQLQQEGISKLVNIIKDDLKSLNIISAGTKQILQSKNVLMN